jgi:hypothetical protein
VDVWLSVDDTEHGPDGRAWHVEVGSEVHKRLLAEGAHEVPDPTGSDKPVTRGRARASKNAKKADLVQSDEATDQANGGDAGGEDDKSPEGDELS